MLAVFKREFRAYFYTPLGYVFIGAYYLLTGFFFFNYNLYGNSSDMRALFDVLFTVTLFLIPILTMRLMSEDRKMKTDQILLMSPVTSAGVVCGKFFAALCVYLLAMSGTLADSLILEITGAPEWPLIAGHFSGLLLLGCCLIAIGLFISALTENQIIAAIGGFCAGLLLMLLDSVAPLVSAAGVSAVLKGMSFRLRYQPFTLGIFGFDNIIFFISVCAFFIFLAVEQFEKRRWA
jgi:ABC-2 type transport system permease protein